jgi:hypothetical protein
MTHLQKDYEFYSQEYATDAHLEVSSDSSEEQSANIAIRYMWSLILYEVHLSTHTLLALLDTRLSGSGICGEELS